MATFTATRADATFPVAGPGDAGSAKMAFGTIAISANPVAGDIYEMCTIPRGAVVTGGYLMASDIDTNTTETLDMDLGWAANGVEAADSAGLGDLGVWTGDATGTKPEVGSYFAAAGVLLTAGPVSFSKKTTIQVECVATAATFAAGQLTVVIFYNVG